MIKPSERIAIITKERQVTFNQMLRSISLFSTQTPAEAGSKTLIFCENREGWLYALYSVWNNHGIVVPVDAGSTVHDVAYIINDCKPQAIWVSEERRAVAEEAIKEAGHEMQLLVVDDLEQADASSLQKATITFDENDTCLICYTSGTTGSPKGVMLSFRNIYANMKGVVEEVPIFTPERRSLILLPLHHVLPLVGSAVIPMVVGGGVAISPSLAAADIMDTLSRGQIAIMIGVPRLWQTLFRGIKGKIDANVITRTLYNICAKAQCRSLSRLVFKSVRSKMGGHITYCVSGGAALDSATALGLKTLGLDVLEGYGMTETSPIIAFTRPDDIRPGCVGLPLPSVEVKLVDGELCARGNNVMQGYYNRPEETAAIIDSDGFVHTGDLAEIDAAGRITITGRKKEIIVLSNGKNINPSEIEEKLEKNEIIVKEVAVTQDGDMLKAIVVPQPAWAAGMSIEQQEEAIKQQLLQPYNANVAPYKKLMSLLVYHGELPRTRLDKLQRFKLKQLVEQSKGEAKQQQAPVQEILMAELKVIADYIKGEKHIDVKPTDSLETDLAMDSLDKVALQGFLEQTFGINVTTEQLVAFPSVEDLAVYVADTKTRMEVEDIDWNKILHADNTETNTARMPRKSSLRTLRLFKWMCEKMLRQHVSGTENIPSQGPVIFAPNHQSFLDVPLVVGHLGEKVLANTFFYAKKDHFDNALLRSLASSNNVIIMDMNSLKDSIHMLGNVLSHGNNLVIFPEGTRTTDGKLGAFKKTFAILSKELGVPVVPVRIEGAYEAWPRHRMLPRPHDINITYLPAIQPAETDTYEQLAERVRKAIEG